MPCGQHPAPTSYFLAVKNQILGWLPETPGLWSRGLPARSLAPVVTTALYFVPGRRLLLGLSVIVLGVSLITSERVALTLAASPTSGSSADLQRARALLARKERSRAGPADGPIGERQTSTARCRGILRA